MKQRNQLSWVRYVANNKSSNIMYRGTDSPDAVRTNLESVST
jgi:hypothetical protein